MAKKFSVYGAGGTPRNVSKFAVYGAGGTPRNVKNAWVYGNDGTPRQFFASIQPSGFSMLTANLSLAGLGARGFERSAGGVLTPTPGFGPLGLECRGLYTLNSSNVFRLILDATSDPGQSAFTSMTIPGFGSPSTWATASASYNWNVTASNAATWQWNTSANFAAGVTVTVSFTPP